MDYATILGLVAGAFTSLCGLPQVKKIIETKSASDVSYKMLFSLCFGAALWVAFGIVQEEIAIIVTNALTLAINFTIIYLKWRYGATPSPNKVLDKS